MTPLILRLALRRSPSALQRLARLAPELALFLLVVAAVLWIIVGCRAGERFQVLLSAVPSGGGDRRAARSRWRLPGPRHHPAWPRRPPHRYGYDANTFTEFQTLMLVLTATGLVVGVVVTERVHAHRAIRQVEDLLRKKEAEVMQAARVNLVSGMASALAHEINQPMTAARALARSAQHLVRGPNGDLARADGNLTDMIAQIDHAAAVVRRMRDFLRRGASARQHDRRAPDAGGDREAAAARRLGAANRYERGRAGRLAADPWRSGAAGAGHPQPDAQRHGGDRRNRARRRAHPFVRTPLRAARTSSRSVSPTTAPGSMRAWPAGCSSR